MNEKILNPGQILTGTLFSEPIRVAMENEQKEGRQVYEVHKKNLGYDITSLDLSSGGLRLVEVKGISTDSGTILPTPNERQVAEDRRDCYWLYIVTGCKEAPKLRGPVKDPARLKGHEVKKVDQPYHSVDALIQLVQIREGWPTYEEKKNME